MRLAFLNLSTVTCVVLACVSTSLAAPRPAMVVSARADGDKSTEAYAAARESIQEQQSAANTLMAMKYGSDSKAAAAQALVDLSKPGAKNTLVWPPLSVPLYDNVKPTLFQNPEEAKEMIGKAVLKLKEQGDLQLPDAISKEAPSKVYEHLSIQKQINRPARVVFSDKSVLIPFGIVYNGDPKWKKGHWVYLTLLSNGQLSVQYNPRTIVD